MTLRSPFPSAHAALLARWLNSPREPNFAEGQPSDAATVATMLAAKEAAGATFCCTLEGMPIGFIGFKPLGAHEGQFAGMVMAPEFRGMGYGRQFLAMVVGELHRRGFTSMSALVRAENAAVQRAFRSAGAVEEWKVLTFKADN